MEHDGDYADEMQSRADEYQLATGDPADTPTRLGLARIDLTGREPWPHPDPIDDLF